MKRFLKIIAMFIILIVTTACGKSNINCEERLIKDSKQIVQEWGIVLGRTYTVTLEGNIYTANINGNIQKIHIPELDKEQKEIYGIGEVSDNKIKSICKDANTKLKQYIDTSSIIKDKENVKNQIDKIQIMITELDYPAVYYKGNIYIGKAHMDYVCEWMILHEYVHALADITNQGVENEQYALTDFNEALTDIITAYMEPNIKENTMSAYIYYYKNIMAYIGCFEEKAIYAYFYGYDEMYQIVEKDELDFYVFSFQNMLENEVAQVCVNNFINKWGSLVIEQQ